MECLHVKNEINRNIHSQAKHGSEKQNIGTDKLPSGHLLTLFNRYVIGKKMNDNIKITCDNCDYSEIKTTNIDWACPNCGKKKCHVKMSLSDSIGPIHDSISGRQFNPTKRKEQGKTGKSAKKPIQEFFHGDDYSNELEKFVDKDRIIDRENDHYHEMVKDKESGEVIHHKTEKLSEHFGHGSAKKNNGDT